MWICFNSKLLYWILLITSLFLICWNSLYSYAILNAIRSQNIVLEELNNLKNDIEELKVKLTNPSWMTFNKDADNSIKDVCEEKAPLSDFKRLCEVKDQQSRLKSRRTGVLQSILKRQPKESSLEIYEKVKTLVSQESTFDKTGMVDFALESSGGRIVSIRNTKPFDPHGVDSKTLLGVKICDSCMGPQAILQANSLPGECWAFRGSTGSAIIQLLGYISITQVSLEHIPKKFSPTGKIDSAPKEFSVRGLNQKTDARGEFLGRFFYDINGPPIQKFKVANVGMSYLFVDLKIHSNHGNAIFTCVYRNLVLKASLTHIKTTT